MALAARQRISARKHRPDYGIVLITGILILIGLIVLFSIGPAIKESANITIAKHFAIIAIGIMAFLATSLLPLNIWHRLQPILILISVVASFALLFAPEVNGATRWISLGPFFFQPSELLKFTLIIYLATFLAKRSRQDEIEDKSQTLIPLTVILGVLSAFVVIFQRDLGTAIVIVSIMMLMLYVAEVPIKQLALLSGGLLATATLAILVAEHRIARLLTFLDPSADAQGAGYHINQALIAIGSGGVFGLGLGQSVQAYGYLPEAANDSIFAVYAEKFGFVGTVLTLFIFGILLIRIIRIIERSPNMYTKLLVTGVFAWLFTHLVINVGAMLSLLPLTGITLPLLSYGGSALVLTMAGLGLVFNVSRYTTFESKRKGATSESSYDRRRNRRTRYAS